MVPLRGNRPNGFAGLVADSATSRSRLIPRLGGGGGEKQQQSCLDAGRAIRDPAEIADPVPLGAIGRNRCLVDAEGAMVGGHDLQIIALQGAPQAL